MVWICDTGAFCHITPDISHLLECIRYDTDLTLVGVACLHTLHMGSLQLDMEIGGSIHLLPLADVAYEPDCTQASLISCRKIDILGRFRMIGKDDIITAQCKYAHSGVLIGDKMYECYQVRPVAYHDKIYTTATNFWVKAWSHSSPCFCSTAVDIYWDSSLIARRTSWFFCRACRKYSRKHTVPLSICSPLSKNPLHLIHADLLAPLIVEFLGGPQYMRTFA